MNATLRPLAPPPGGTDLDPSRLIAAAQSVFDNEARALLSLRARVDATFVAACRTILASRGRVITTGMGKSGHIASKIAATMASTGTPAFFVHPGEASHGDLGMITEHDVVLALSYSGESDEVLTIVPALRRQGNTLIAMTGRAESTLARLADIHLDVAVGEEACPLGLAPTTSTTASLAMGDAIAVTLLEARGFTSQDFARSHPAGSLGRRLLLRIADVMHAGEEIPRVPGDATISQAVVEMSRKRLGMTAVVDRDNRLLGVFTDGDLRRAMDDPGADLRTTPVAAVMGREPKTLPPERLAVEAARMMEDHKISAVVVVDEQQLVMGALNIHDLLRARVV